MKALIILLLSVSMYGQVSSGGPVAQVESKKIVSGLRNAPDRSDGRLNTLIGGRNRSAGKYLALESAMVVSAAFDTGTTIHNLRNGCHENNPLMGSHPSTARVVAFEAGWTAGELVIAHFLRHRHPKIAAVLLGESLIEHGVAGGLNSRQRCF